MEEAELDEDILNTAHILTVQWVRLIRRTRPTDSDIRKVQAPWAHGLKRTHDHDLHCYVKESHLIEVLVLISVCTSMCFLHWLLCTVCNGNSSKHDSQKAKWVKCRIYWFNNGRRKSCILFCSREKFNTAQSVVCLTWSWVSWQRDKRLIEISWYIQHMAAEWGATGGKALLLVRWRQRETTKDSEPKKWLSPWWPTFVQSVT